MLQEEPPFNRRFFAQLLLGAFIAAGLVDLGAAWMQKNHLPVRIQASGQIFGCPLPQEHETLAVTFQRAGADFSVKCATVTARGEHRRAGLQ